MSEIATKSLSELAILASREKIMNLEYTLVSHLKEQNPEFKPGNTDDICPIKHHWAPGVYGREIFIPAGTVIIGKIHRHAHLNCISQGLVMVATPFGVETLQAPLNFISKPWTKRAVYALEDTIWTTIHPTEKLSVEEVESEIIAASFDEAPAITKGESS
jgi:hypothetical protein